MALPSRGNGTGPTATTPASVAAGGITDNGTGSVDISTDPCELNKLNAGKLGFWSVSLASNQGQSSACKSRRARRI